MKSTFRKAILEGSAVGLPVRTLGLKGRSLVYINAETCAVLIDRKSRFLRKDAQQFVNILNAAIKHEGQPLNGVIIIKKAPVCSQAKAWLEAQGIAIDLIND